MQKRLQRPVVCGRKTAPVHENPRNLSRRMYQGDA
jgi:hypothetical protein